MKLKRAMLVTGMVISLVGVNIQGTFGLENGGTAVSDSSEAGSEKLQENQSGNSLEDQEESSSKDQGEDNSGSQEGDNSGSQGGDNSGDQEGDNSGSQGGDNSGDQEGDNSGSQEGDNSGDQEGDNSGDQEGDNSGSQEGDNSGSQEGDNSGGQSGGSSVPGQDTGSGGSADSGEESHQNSSSGSVIWDNSADAVYTGNVYNPSDLYVDNRDKVKYNVAIPIEGIPSFVTQEMIIGALKCQDETGFPASVTIAQIIQESGFGKYGPEGTKGQGLSYLAYQYNNLFGIKGTGPAGSVNMRTGEQTPAGESYMTTAGFRVYNTYTESIEDRTKLLKEVYSDLIKGSADANTFAMRIGGRWATDVQYGQSLIKQMETYDLYRLDKMTLGEFSEMIGKFADPCPGSHVSSNFGWRDFTNSFHRGIDLGTGAYNIPTYAAEAGTVIEAGWNDSAGNWIIIDHGNGLVTKYMHHDKMYVTKGQHVEKGQQIGLSGTTGHSTGNHLHFQVEENGVAVDPAPYLGITQ